MDNNNKNSFINLPPKHDQKQSKPPTIKIFRLSQKYFAILGICSTLMVQPYPFNREISTTYLALGSGLICDYIFIRHEAKSFWEYIQSIYLCSISILASAVFSLIAFRASLLFEYIANIGSVLNFGKYA